MTASDPGRPMLSVLFVANGRARNTSLAGASKLQVSPYQSNTVCTVFSGGFRMILGNVTGPLDPNLRRRDALDLGSEAISTNCSPDR